MIAQKTIQEVYDTAKIEDVVQDFMPLKRAGANMKGLCPFHNEKTPSFVVSPGKNLFKCFGCGRGGNPTTFVMEHEKFSYVEAIRYLANKYNIEIIEKELTPEERQAQQMSDSFFVVNDFAKNYFQEQLFETDRGKSIGLSYFKSRGFREETIKKFALGYAPAGVNTFLQYATKEGHKKEMLEKLGLSKNDRDFFRDRVMFTIFNLSGKPIAFGGRTLKKDTKAPKYINSPETDIYSKSKSLFGIYHAKSKIAKLNECLLVEGYTDVISLHQAGFENVVASSGTSLTREQLRLIKRFTPNLKIIYDGDKAGIKAALRGLDLALEADLNVRITLIPDGEDPDSYLQKVGATAFQEFIDKEAKDFILFKTEILLEDAAGDPVKRAGVIRDIVSSIGHIPDRIKQSVYLKSTAQLFEMEEEALMSELNKVKSKLAKERQVKKAAAQRNQSASIADDSGFPQMEPGQHGGEMFDRAPAPTPTSPKVKDEMQEKDIVRILVSGGDKEFDEKQTVAQYIIANIADVIDSFENAGFQLVVNDVAKRLKKKLSCASKHFINHSDQKIAKIAVDLIQSQHEMSEGWADRDIFLQTQEMPELNFTADSIDAIKKFKYKKVNQLLAKNQEQLKKAQDDEDMKKVMKHLKADAKLKAIRSQLANDLKIVIAPF